MSYASDLTDEQWALLEPVFNAPGKRGPKHAPDLRRVVDAMLHISHTGCQWWFLPARVEVAPGRPGRARRAGAPPGRGGGPRRRAKSFENTTTSATGWLQVACIATTLRHLSAVRG